MDNKDFEFQKRIRATFRIEAEEHTSALSTQLIALEKSRSDNEKAGIIELLFREVHSLKGAARSIDQKEIESLCIPLESVFSALKRQEISLSSSMFDLIHKTISWLAEYIGSASAELSADTRKSQQGLIINLKEIVVNKPPAAVRPEQSQIVTGPSVNDIPGPVSTFLPPVDIQKNIIPINAGMVRVPISKLDPLLLQAEEMLQSKIAIDQRINELKLIFTGLAGWKNEIQKWKSLRAHASPAMWNEWCDENELYLKKTESQTVELTHLLEHDQHSLDRIVNNHLESMKQVLMLPVDSMVEAFPAMVREISREQEKEIDFIVSGSELEIDKRVLEELKEPLIHMIRNSISHGIGKPLERLQKNKSERGTIKLAFSAKESGLVEISLSDDGKGIDKDLVLKAAIKSRIISKETSEKLGEKDVIDLIFQSGISTSAIITDISGHGLGMSIVMEKINKMNGKITVETEPNKGTTFKILLPMTLATFRGVIVKVNEFTYIIPTLNVERVLKLRPEEIKTVENQETIRIEDEIISVVDLALVLGLPEHKHVGQKKIQKSFENSDYIRVIVLISGEHRIAFKVDLVDEELQVLVKGLGKLLSRVRNFSGATIMGSGKVVPVLNVTDLLRSALTAKGGRTEHPSGESPVEKAGKILVAEDSITSRTLIKNILESAGYKVTTAVDGADGYSKARIGNFDLIVSDVDMPKMNGFELTAKIRGDKKIGETPVILLTALESREDKEHGIEVGADAYIVKSSFDQGNLLEVIKKLI